MPEVRSPTVRRRELGALLRTLRTGRGLTVEQVAAELLCSPSKVSRMETGQRGATPRDVRDLCDLYRVGEAERTRLMRLAREGRQQGWWQSFALPYSTFVGLEQEAISLKVYQSAVVPGIFQESDYSRALHRAAIPSIDEAVIEQRVEERSRRRQLLTREDPPRLEVVLDEAVLHRPIGGSATMVQQLGHITKLAQLPNVTLQVLPFEIGAHPALESDFVILEFAGHAGDVVYVEGLAGQIYLERKQDVDRYLEVFTGLQGMASSPKDSAVLIRKIRETYTSV